MSTAASESQSLPFGLPAQPVEVVSNALNSFITSFEEWLGLRNLELLYQSSTDGLSNESFHAHCDGKGPTATLVVLESGFAFGGFTRIPWTSPDEDKTVFFEDSEAFLFRLISGDGAAPVRCKRNTEEAVGRALVHSRLYGPAFGYDSTYSLLLNLDRLELSSSIVSKAFALPDDECDGSSFLAGTRSKWSVKDVLVLGVDVRPVITAEVAADTTVEQLGVWLEAVFDHRVLYRASVDGFDAKVFHDRCDGNRRTATVVVLKDGHVFGGYTTFPWESPKGDMGDVECVPHLDQKAFVFSITDGKGREPFRCARVSEKGFAVCHSARLGPLFGCSLKFGLWLNLNAMRTSHSELGTCYECPEGMVATSALAGRRHDWFVEDVLVLSLTKLSGLASP